MERGGERESDRGREGRRRDLHKGEVPQHMRRGRLLQCRCREVGASPDTARHLATVLLGSLPLLFKPCYTSYHNLINLYYQKYIRVSENSVKVYHFTHKSTYTSHTTVLTLHTQQYLHFTHNSTYTSHTTVLTLHTQQYLHFTHNSTYTLHTTVLTLYTQQYLHVTHNSTYTSHTTVLTLHTQQYLHFTHNSTYTSHTTVLTLYTQQYLHFTHNSTYTSHTTVLTLHTQQYLHFTHNSTYTSREYLQLPRRRLRILRRRSWREYQSF